MAEFEVTAVQIDEVMDHPDADRLSLNRIGGFISISNKVDGEHRYKAGDVVIYVPEGAVMPDYLLQRMNLWKDGKGMLAGSRGDRVKAIKLRGVVSQGLIIPADNFGWVHGPSNDDGRTPNARKLRSTTLGEDYAEFLGITKYEPVIPAGMSGDLVSSTETIKFDVENGQKYPDVFGPDDYVYVTEKLHGTFAAFVFSKEPQEGWLKINDTTWGTAYSKGLGSKGLVFKDTEKNRTSNLYVRAMLDFFNRKEEIDVYIPAYVNKITLMGEIYGRGVQDLTYSTTAPQFALFDMILDDDFVSHHTLMGSCNFTVPLLWEGRYADMPAIETLRDGKSSIDNSTIREGVVIRCGSVSRPDERIGRKMVKMVSPDYLTRKGGTELQ